MLIVFSKCLCFRFQVDANLLLYHFIHTSNLKSGIILLITLKLHYSSATCVLQTVSSSNSSTKRRNCNLCTLASNWLYKKGDDSTRHKWRNLRTNKHNRNEFPNYKKVSEYKGSKCQVTILITK